MSNNFRDLSRSPSRRAIGAFILIFAFGAYLRLFNFTDTWTYDMQGSNGAYMSLIARNYLRYGFWNLRFTQVLDGGPIVADSEIYTHHPPGVPILVALSFRLFHTQAEWAARLAPYLFSLGVLALLFVVTSKICGERVALLACFFTAVVPMATYFASNVCYEVVSTCGFLGMLYFYFRYIETPRVTTFLALLLTFLASALLGWPAFYAVPILCAHYWLLAPQSKPRLFYLFPWLAAGLFLLYLSYMAWVDGGVQGLSIFKSILHTTPGRTGQIPYGFGQWFSVVILEYSRKFYTTPLLILVVLWVALFIRERLRRRPVGGDVLAVLTLLYGTIHLGLGQNWAYTHDYWQSLWTPGFAIAGALVLERFYATVILRRAKYASILKIGFFLALLGFSGYTTYTLYAWHDATPARDRTLGLLVNRISRMDEQTLAAIDDIIDPVVFRFYSDRNVMLGVTTLESFRDYYQGDAFYEGNSWAGGMPFKRTGLTAIYAGQSPRFRYFIFPESNRMRYTSLFRFLEFAFAAHRADEIFVFDLQKPNQPEEDLIESLNHWIDTGG